MSSISLSGATPALYPQLTATTTNDALLDNSAGVSSTEQTEGSLGARNPFLSGGQFDPSPDANLFQSIQQSVTSALSSAQGNSAADANQVVQQAISQAIQQSGTGSTSSTGNDGGTDSTQSFFDTLQSYGISPQQFQSSFLSAVQQAQQGGGIDTSSVFSGFPTGLSVNTAG